jgi:hypothetical protein
MDVLVATDFFTTEVWTWGAGDVLCIIHHTLGESTGPHCRRDTASS